MQIIDSHCHAGKGDGLTGPWDTNAPIGKYLERAKELGISKTVIFSAIHSDYSIANRKIFEVIRKFPNRFLGYAFVNAVRDKGRIFKMVDVAVNKFGFRGIKVHRHDGRITREICESARKFRIPILYDVMGEVQSVELFASEYPDINFIIPHLSSFADDWKAQKAFIDKLVRFSNVFTDTSGVKRFDLLEEAVKRAGADKILFGSDGPWLHPAVEMEKVFALKLVSRDENKILGGNFLRLIGKRKANL